MIFSKTNVLKIAQVLVVQLVLVYQVWAQRAVVPPDANWTLTGNYQHATLMGWASQSEMMLFDRSNSPYGLVTDRGWMYQYTNRKEDEFQMNMMSFNPTYSDDYLFYRSPNAVRFVTGDYNDVDFYTASELQLNVQLIPKHSIKVWSYMERSPVLSRMYMNVAYSYEINSMLSAGVRHSLGSRQDDLDATAFAQYGNEQIGLIKLEFTAADYMNNMVNSNVGIPYAFPDTIRRYKQAPFMLHVSAVTPPGKRYRAELFATYQTEAKSEIKSALEPLDQYKYNFQNWFAGGLLEYKFENYTVGSIAKYMYSTSDRDSLELNPSYSNEQIEFQKGFYIIANASQITWDSWLWMVDFQEIQSAGRYLLLAEVDKKFLNKETRVYIHNRISVHPDYKGFLFGIEHLLDLRKRSIDLPNKIEDEVTPRGYDPLLEVYPYAFNSNNNRLILNVGYQFQPRAKIRVGYGLDLDNDFHRVKGGERYDNFFVRIEYRW
ncbi:hypothetical protein EP331_11390 [bacterium]|nr:MAG: hypothetical protein EP331_11390 [bacterium]